MNTLYRKPFKGNVTEWAQRCKELHPKGVQEFYGAAIYWVADGIDVGAFHADGTMTHALFGSWIKEKFQ